MYSENHHQHEAALCVIQSRLYNIHVWVQTSPLVDVVTLDCSISMALVSCFPAKNLKVKNPAAKEMSHFHNQQEVLSPQEIKQSVIFL